MLFIFFIANDGRKRRIEKSVSSTRNFQNQFLGVCSGFTVGSRWLMPPDVLADINLSQFS